MDGIELLRTRRSCKDFADTPVTKEMLIDIIEDARHSPAPGAKIPWRFVLMTDRKVLAHLSEGCRTWKWLGTAPAAIIVITDASSNRYWLENCSIAAYSIWLGATARGLGAVWGAVYQGDNPEESARRQQYIRETLSIPESQFIPMLIALGLRKSAPPERAYPAIEDITCWDSFKEKQPA
jgi:nitroreductase